MARIKLGLQQKLKMGNLDAERDWGFAGRLRARDVADAILKGAPGALDAAFGLGRVGGDLLDADSSRARPS